MARIKRHALRAGFRSVNALCVASGIRMNVLRYVVATGGLTCRSSAGTIARLEKAGIVPRLIARPREKAKP